MSQRSRREPYLTAHQIARRLGCSDSKVSRIETGQVTATPQDVRDMLDLYGIAGEQQEADRAPLRRRPTPDPPQAR